MSALKKTVIVVMAAAMLIAGWLHFVKGYYGVRVRRSVPTGLINEARVPGMGKIRVLLDPIRPNVESLYDQIFNSELDKPHFSGPEANVLVVSGGGANGAYGAGILCGWTAAGSRPVFDVVTGVSTGALIAPAAFLGSSCDNILRDIYTNVSSADIATQNIMQFIDGGRPSLFDTRPLRRILKRSVTMNMMNAMSAEHSKGRRLYIATTNLDARRLVVWDMGAIAKAGTPEALDLFRSVMLASASIPVAFPPVMIDVEAGSQEYEEMHVDGSVSTQLFGALFLAGTIRDEGVKTRIFIIRNGKVADVPEEVGYNIWSIAGAAFLTTMTWHSYGDIYRFAAMAREEGVALYVTFMPYDFNIAKKGEFDPVYMRALFKTGYGLAEAGNEWLDMSGGRFMGVRLEK